MPRIGRSFPPQWSEPNIGGSERALGPEPPQVVALPPVVTTLSINLATGLLTNQRRAQQRRCSLMRGTPIVETGGVGAISTGTQSSTTNSFGTLTSQRTATSFVASANVTATSLSAYLKLTNSPTDDALVTLQTDSGDNPSGTVLATLDVPAASLATTPALFTVGGLSVPLTSGTKYWIVFGRSGAPDASNNYQAVGALSASATYAAKFFNGTTWGSTNFPNVFSLLTAGDTLAAYASTIGPQPPLVIAPAPSAPPPPPISVNLASDLLRRRTMTRRFPLQGWEGVAALQLGGIPLFANRQPSTPFLDQFTRADENPLSGGGNWTSLGGNFQIISGNIAASQIGAHSIWNSGMFTDCEAYATVVALPATSAQLGVLARMDSQKHGYALTVTNTGDMHLWNDNGGSLLSLTSVAAGVVAGDTIALRCVGRTIEGWVLHAGVWTRQISVTNTLYVSGTLGVYSDQTGSFTGKLTAFGGGGRADTLLPLVQPLLGVRRPLALTALAPPVQVNFATGLLTNQRRNTERKTMYDLFGFIPQVSAQPPPPIQVNLASGLYTNQRRVQQRHPDTFYTESQYLSPLAVVTTPGQLVVAVHATRARPRPARSALPLTVAAASTFATPPIRVTLVRGRPRPTEGAVAPPLIINPLPSQTQETTKTWVVVARPRPVRSHLPVVIGTTAATFAGPEVTLQAVQTRAQRQRRRLPDSFLSPPATLEPETVALAERQIRVTLARTRPRHTLGTKLGYTVYPATSDITVALVRTRPRPTRHALTATTYPQTGAGFTHLVRARPRPTRKFVAPPATLQPYAVTVAEDTVRVTAVRTRPRPTTRRVNPPTVLQVFTGPAAPLVRTRPRPTQRRLTAISYPATRAIRVVLTRTRPRPTSRTLGPLIFYAQTSEIAATLARIRPRRTVATVRPPAVTSVAQAFYGPSVLLARTRPRRVTSELAAAVFYAATSEITVTAVRTRPRPTRHLLTAITYQQTGVGFQHLVRTRPRPTTRFLLPPATLQPYAVTLAEDTVRVTAVRTRPRHTLGTRLIPPTVLRTFAGPAVTLTHTRPHPTLRRLGPPTVVRVPSVEQREDTITVALVHTRPRPTDKFIVPPLVKTFPPVVTTLLPAHVIKTRPRPTTRFLRPPTVVIPLPTLRMQTISVATVRTRPRPTRHSLTPLAFYRQTSKIQVVLTRARPRPTKRILTAVRYEQTTEITVALTRIRPRPTRHLLAPPTVLQTFGPPAEVEIAVRVPLEDRARRRPRSFAIQPVTYAAQSELAVKLTRTRPRPTHSILRPPAVLRAFVAAPVTVTSVRTRPRRTHSFLLPPTAVRTFTAQPILVATVTTRPQPTTARIEPPTRLRPIEATLHVTLARTRPRHVRSNLPSVAVVTEPPTVTTLTVVLTQARPRPTRSLLAAPATLRRVAVFTAEPIRVTTVTTRPPRTQAEFVGPFRLISVCGWTSGEVVAATDSAGSSILVSGTDGGAVPVAVTESEVAPVAQSEGEDSATGRTEGMDKLAGT